MSEGNVRPANMERITTPALAQKFIEEQIVRLRAQIGDKNVLLALSGGVDSSVVATLLIKAVGSQLVAVHTFIKTQVTHYTTHHLKGTIQWLLVYSQCHGITITINFRIFSSQKEAL